MNALTILKALVALVTSVANYLHDKRLLEAGAAEAVLKGLNDANEAILLANDARGKFDRLSIDADPENRDSHQ